MDLKTFFEHFDTLAEAPNGLQRLRELILDMAVRGKLVPQDPEDEPAEDLLSEIVDKRKYLIKEKVIKRIKTAPLENDADTLENLPKGWTWIRLGSIAEKLGAGSTPLGGRNVYVDEGVKFLRSQNVWNDGLRLESVAKIPLEIHQKMSGTWVQPGDVLLNITGASIGRCAVVPDDFDEGASTPMRR
jgi:type I restriction enzyme S subunit